MIRFLEDCIKNRTVVEKQMMADDRMFKIVQIRSRDHKEDLADAEWLLFVNRGPNPEYWVGGKGLFMTRSTLEPGDLSETTITLGG